AASLSSQLRAVVECTLEEIEQATFQEFQLASANPTCMSFLSCEPLEGEIILEINPTIVYMMFDKLIGGSAARSMDTGRPMTEIEWRVMGGVLNRVRDQLRAAWEGIEHLDFQFSARETNPMLAQTIPPNEPVVLVTFELTVGGEETGNMVLCLPHNVIEPLLNRMSSFWFSSKVHRTEESTRYIRGKLTSAPIEIIAYLKETTISAAELLRLGIGDVIQLPHKTTDEVALSIDGQVKFVGMPGIFEKRNRKAVRLTRIVEQSKGETAAERAAQLQS
ncbi:MAG: FliM/FliN family flagellar motor switch protein, partial [Planctomycetes bacterium]|nr:FliM/FliN family flagellar motor switch protein [Planctomycetota bacterium]